MPQQIVLSRRISLILCVLFITSPIIISPASSDITITINTKLLSTSDDRFGFHVEPSMAIQADGSIIAGWKDSTSHDGPGLATSYVISKDGGQTWSDPKFVPTTFKGEDYVGTRVSAQSDPWIRTFENTMYYVYIEYNSSTSQITLAKSTDTGTTWKTTKASYNQGFSDKETLTIDTNGNLYIVYDDVGINGTKVRLSRSFDNGETFFENVTISDLEFGDYVGPYALARNNSIYVAFTQFPNSGEAGDICFDQSSDNGNTWHADTDINPSGNASVFTINENRGSPMKVSLPVLESDSNNRLYLAWDDISTDPSNTNWDVYFRYSDDKGQNWSDKMRVNKALDRSQWMPEMAIDGKDNVHFIYYDEISDNQIALKYRIWNTTTEEFGDETTISKNEIPTTYTRLGEYTTMEIDDTGAVHMVWTGVDNSGLDIYYTKLTRTETTNSGSTTKSPFLELNLIVIAPLLIYATSKKHLTS